MLCLGVLFSGTATAQRAQYGLQYMAQFDKLSEWVDAACKLDSSSDKVIGTNNDAGHFLYTYSTASVMAKIDGPGCIYRVWSANPSGTIKFYFDGEATPRIDCTFQSMLQGSYSPFAPPLSRLSGSYGDGWCYFPIPFSQSCRVEVSGAGSGLFYQIQYHTYPAGTQVTTFSRTLSGADQTALATVNAQFNNYGLQPPVALPGNIRVRASTASVPAGGTATILDEHTGGTIRSLRIRPTPDKTSPVAAGSVISNGTFESGATTGWNTSGAA
jgi:hypothetical protein